MRNIFAIAAFVSIIFLFAKFIEMRFIEKENKPLKQLIRDTIIVYFSVIISDVILEQVQPMVKGGNISIHPQIFTDNPEF